MSALSLTVLKISGMRIRLHVVFLVVLLLYAAADRLAEGVISFAIVLLHELGHLLAARANGYRALEIEMLPIGGVLTIREQLRLTPAIEASIALAGPLVNLLLLGIGYALAPWWTGPHSWLDFYMQSNLMIFSFNLLPILPLDGGRILRALLSRRQGFRRATAQVVRLGRFATALMLLLGAILIWLGEVPLSLIFMALLLYQMTAKEKQSSAYSLVNHLAAKQSDLQRRHILDVNTLAVDEHTQLGEVGERLVGGRYHLLYVIRQGRVVTELTEQQFLAALVEHGAQAQLRDII